MIIMVIIMEEDEDEEDDAAAAVAGNQHGSCHLNLSKIAEPEPTRVLIYDSYLKNYAIQ
jgi:hypothetical protein